MATSPLKITVNPAFPKNEIDLICMLLAGRLRDLWNGKLFCAQLAINDLLKDAAGIDALGGLRDALNGLKGGLDAFKSISGYDAILAKVNQTLSGASNVFSLGGLCPSPVTPPKIPDILGQLNQNLFGQANNILNALVQASTPQMCFGGGPGGFGVNWNSMNGNLKNLKNAINEFKNNPAGLGKTMQAFEANLNAQNRRLQSELDRLAKNLTDPLGVTDKQATARKLQRANTLSGDYPIKDRRGIERVGLLDPMIPADVKSVLNRNDKLSTTPITFRIDPVLDYCGDTVGYKKVAISGDPEYIGWTPDPRYDDLNTLNPTTNPTSSFLDYDYLFTDNDGPIKVQNIKGEYVDVITLTRGKSYRIGFKLNNNYVKFYTLGGDIWTNGITYGTEPNYGIGADGPGQIIIDEKSFYKPEYRQGEAQWDVVIENPTTPDQLVWTGGNGQNGNVIVDGLTSILPEDRSYDLSMAFKKGLMHYRKVTEEGLSFDRIKTTDRFNVRLNLKLNDGTTYQINYNNSTIPHRFANNITTPTSYVVYKNIDNLDIGNNPLPGNKIVKYITDLPDGKYLIEKMYLNDTGGIKFQEINFYITNSLVNEDIGFRSLFNVKFESELIFMNDTKLPYDEDYSYYWSAPLGDSLMGIKDYNLFDSDEHTFEIVDNDKLRLWLTSHRTTDFGANEFLWSSTVKIDPDDLSRSYVDTDPYLLNRRLYVKGLDGTFLDYEIIYKDNSNPDTALSSPNANTIGNIVEEARLSGAVTHTPLTLTGGVQPYEYKLINRTGGGYDGGMEFNEKTGQLYGVPSIIMSTKEYEVEGTDLLGDETKRGRFTFEVIENAGNEGNTDGDTPVGRMFVFD